MDKPLRYIFFAEFMDKKTQITPQWRQKTIISD
jgi:hypothetical protein